MPHTGAYILFDVLKHFSITNIVGYPGGCALPLYDELHRRKGEIKHYLSTHEQGAMHIAQWSMQDLVENWVSRLQLLAQGLLIQ